ncbi:alpha/beta hydrolase [Gordonia sp. zg691]|uniref:alpha/beta fold hydrolase n=1 Tax=Gordonia jinghuaiqii TaxID=2758710 RepID=UPI0016623211|nr:alpha/beta hydrolase [Gordonia jinghuaiqii]MBD0862966.1 alpha/beta hydrolase [Gordonia jinghuaiqii]
MTPGDAGGAPGEFVTVGEHRLHVLDEGSGPPLLLMAALGSNWFDLDPLVARLASSWRVIRYDRPGYGLSSPVGRHHHPSLLGEVERMAAVLDARGVDEPVVVVGHSLASLYVEAFARRHPERTAGVVILDGSFVLVPWRVVPLSFRTGNAHRFVGAARAVTSRVGIRRWPSLQVWTRVVPAPPEGRGDQQRRWGARIFGQPPFLLALLVENAAFGAMNNTLRGLRRTRPMPDVPVIVVVASSRLPGYREFWQWKQQRYAEVLSADEIAVLPRTKHFLVSERPDDVAEIIEGMRESDRSLPTRE